MISRTKIVLLVLALAGSLDDAYARLSALGLSAGLIVYLGIYAMLLLALLAAAHVRQSWLRLGYAVIFAIGVLFYEGFRHVGGTPPSYDSFVTMISTRESAGDALGQNIRFLALAALEAALLFAAIVWKVPQRPLTFAKLFPALPIGAFAALSAMLYLRGGDGANGLPPAFPVLGYAAIHAADSALNQPGPRQSVKLAKSGPPKLRNIVLVVDESIAANYLDINNPNGVRSGLAEPKSGVGVANFGIAASASTCSASSNVTLRHGGTRQNYQRINGEMPSIFAYAKQAGMQTAYIDGQGHKGQLINLMDAKERAQIDDFIQLDPAPVQDRDMLAAANIARITRQPGAHFILINKVGAHFPVQDKFPDDHMAYRPLPPRGTFTNISDISSREIFDGKPESWRLYRNAYRNTLTWNVGAFFDSLLGEADLVETLVIYTSDHGQRLHEGGDNGAETHCMPDALPQDGAVPLVVIAPDTIAAEWQAAATVNRSKVSHFQIFPSLLGLMGYDAAAIAKTYGADLLAPSRDPMTFNAFYNARMGKKPVWVKVDPAKLPTPPASDYAK